MSKSWSTLNQALAGSLACLKGVEANDGLAPGGEARGNYADVVEQIGWLEKAIEEQKAPQAIVAVWGTYSSEQKFGPIVMVAADLATWMMKAKATVRKVTALGGTLAQLDEAGQDALHPELYYSWAKWAGSGDNE
jgi:hypothetical protein